MITIHKVMEESDKYCIYCKDLEQARALWDLVKEIDPKLVSNWKTAGPPRDPEKFVDRAFTFASFGVGKRLVHGDAKYHRSRILIPFAQLLMGELPEFESCNDLSLLF